jgi:multidrug resistance efflux pump
MRFKQSGFRPYDRDSAVISVNSRTPTRRLWRIRPRTTLFVVSVAILAAFAADQSWIRGNGIVAGQLTEVSPIVQARLVHLFVNCLDHVKAGQRLAEFRNEATSESAAQQLQQLELQLTQARAGIDIADHEAQAALKLVDAQRTLFDQLVLVEKAESELLKSQFVAELVYQKAKADADRAEAETRAAEFVYETKQADKKKAELDAEVLQKRIESFKNSPELTGDFYLTAPKDGIITECTALPGEVIAARTPIFSIFNPNDTYAVVFFDPSDTPRLARGQSFDISIGGLDKPVTGTVTDFYPELSALPNSLTRYFWQQEKWSQYAPVRLDFANVSPAQRGRIFAWAQLSASRARGWGTTDAAAAVTGSWRWVHRHLSGAWQLVSSSFAQQPAGR